MSHFNSRIRVHERGLARAVMRTRRSPLEGTFTTESFTGTQNAVSESPAPHVTIKLPRSTKALIAIGSILGAVLLAFAAWKIRRLIMKKRNPSWCSSSNEKQSGKGSLWRFTNADIGVQQPQRVILPHNASPSTDTNMGWKPQTQPWMFHGKTPSMEANIAAPLPAKMKEIQRTEDDMLKYGVSTSPPPTYLAGYTESTDVKRPDLFRQPETQPLLQSQPQSAPLHGNRFLPPTPPPPSGLPPSPPRSAPPTPPASLKLKFVPGFAHANSPVPSPPRSASFANQQCAPPSTTSSRPTSSASSASTASSGGPRRKRLPRDMVVVQTFVPNLDDELAVVQGETLRLVEEFADGWCLCQRVGSMDGAVVKGVLPRFCLDELRVSRTKSKKKSFLLRRF